MDKIEKERCPVCLKKKLVLMQQEEDIPYFGKAFIFSMECEACGFKKSDVEAEEKKKPCRIAFVVENEKDLKVKLIKSSEATISIPQLKMKVSPGPDSEGYISNIEGMLERLKKILEEQRNNAEDDEEIKKNAKNLLKK
ncbi:ZPR1 zinc finger domain-containing protein, partial [archaeon]|nr:ZPR1 zinc finger domain-containing protein [archaeon]